MGLLNKLTHYASINTLDQIYCKLNYPYPTCLQVEKRLAQMKTKQKKFLQRIFFAKDYLLLQHTINYWKSLWR